MIIENRQETVLCKKDYIAEDGKLIFEAGQAYKALYLKVDRAVYIAEEYNVYTHLDENSMWERLFRGVPKNPITVMAGSVSVSKFLIKYTSKEIGYKVTVIGNMPDFYDYFYDTVQQRKFKLKKIDEYTKEFNW